MTFHHFSYWILAVTIISVLAEPQQRQQQAVTETSQSKDVDDEDGLLPILAWIIVIVYMYLADDACIDESDGEVKVELA